MKQSEFNKIIKTMPETVFSLNTKQYSKLIETIFIRFPLITLKSIEITSFGKIFNIGFQKKGDKCPFCEK